MIVILYLGAVVAANLVIAQAGPAAAVPVALVLVGFDLTARDRLHDRWRGRRLAPRMALLIAAGGAISYLLNRDAAQVALASTVAFVAAAVVDTTVYVALSKSSRLVRVNVSNIASAAVDSVLFPTLAFGAFLPLVVLGQFAAKVLGGWAWSVVLYDLAQRKHRP